MTPRNLKSQDRLNGSSVLGRSVVSGAVLCFVEFVMKRCSRCKELKDASEFNHNRSASDGLHNQCKGCLRLYRQEHKERRAAYAKAYRQTKAGRQQKREGSKRYNLKYYKLPYGRQKRTEYGRTHRYKHPDRAHARNVLHAAVRYGRIRKGSCAECGATERIEGHHNDYSKPLGICWLCQPCHKRLHKGGG